MSFPYKCRLVSDGFLVLEMISHFGWSLVSLATHTRLNVNVVCWTLFKRTIFFHM